MDENNNIPNNNTDSDNMNVFEPAKDTATQPVSAFEMPEEQKIQADTSNTFQSSSGNYYTNTNYTPAPEPVSNGYAIASLVMGILSIVTSCCCGFLSFLFGALGIIFGCIQPKDLSGKKPGMAIAGIITSIVGIVFGVIDIIYLIVIGALSDMTSL
ncbi:MAG: DUF4190 domain-containing protein [Lachnospiraceae bacterium]